MQYEILDYVLLRNDGPVLANPEFTGRWRVVTHLEMGTDVEVEITTTKYEYNFWLWSITFGLYGAHKIVKTYWVGSKNCHFKTVFVPEVLKTFDCNQVGQKVLP